MMKRVYCGKKTKVYIPKTVNPKIISYKSYESQEITCQSSITTLNNAEITNEYSAKRQ